MTPPRVGSVSVHVAGQDILVSLLDRPGTGPVILFLHGLGSTKHDYAAAWAGRALADARIVAFDFPGCGSTPYSAGGSLNVHDLASVAAQIVARLDLRDATVIGHSMGGLAGLLLCAADTDRVRRYVSVEGNLAPEDCFMTRDALTVTRDDATTSDYIRMLADRFSTADEAGTRLFADRFPRDVAPRPFRHYSRSLVTLSDGGTLLDTFIALDCERVFVRGGRSPEFSYLPRLAGAGVRVETIPDAGHWPHLDAPERFLRTVADLVAEPRTRIAPIALAALASQADGDWHNVVLSHVNDHVARMSVLARDFHWHHHDDSDELFYVVDGRLMIDLEDETHALGPGELLLVPRGVRHRTRADGRCVNLTFEARTATPEGTIA